MEELPGFKWSGSTSLVLLNVLTAIMLAVGGWGLRQVSLLNDEMNQIRGGLVTQSQVEQIREHLEDRISAVRSTAEDTRGRFEEYKADEQAWRREFFAPKAQR